MQTLLHKRVVFAVTLPYPLPEQSDVILLSKNSFSWFRGQLTWRTDALSQYHKEREFVTIVLTFDL